MENKSCQGNPGPSRKSDLIIITPDELAKLGLIPEIIHTSTACEKPRNETDGGAVKEKQKRKMCKTYITKNTEENTFDAKIEGKKLVNFENNNEQDVSHTKQDKPHPVTLSPKTINRKFKNINKSSKINKNYNRSNDKVSSNNRNQEKNLSSSEDGKNLKNIEEFKQTMRKSLSKKFQEFSNNTDCDIETYVSEHKINTTYQDLEMKGDANLINTENNLMKVDKGVKIIGNSPICLSDRELKRLVSKSSRLPSGKNVFVSKKNITGFDKKETEENFECKDRVVFKNVSPPSSTIRAAEKKPSKKLDKIEQVEKKIENNVYDIKGLRRTEQKTATELKKENKSPVNKGSHSSTDDGDTSKKIISSENVHGDDKLSKKETVIDNIENVITECKEYKNTGENCGGMNKEQKKMIDIDETSAHSEDSDKKRSAQENTAKRNELEDSKMIEIHKEEMTHDQKLDDANVITKEKEANKVEHNETSAEECYVDENISQNIGKNPPPPKCEKLLQKEEKSPCKTSITIPKKRKYVMNFTVDGVTEKVTRTKEMKNTKSGQDNVNVATETGKNSPNKDLTTNTKRKKTSKIMMHDVLLKQGELEQNVENNSPESSNSNNYKTDLNDNHEENTQNKSCLITNKPKKNYTELSQINGNELSETEMSVKDEIKNKIDIKSIDVEESKTSTESSKTNSNISNNNVHKNEEIETSGNYSKKINNESNELSKQNVKLPKKRGRPKKISDTKDDNSPISDAKEDTSVISVVDLDIEEIVASTPLPKKRGRKKRVEQPVPVEVEEDIELDESRSGRKRKRINYLELVNELEGSNEDAHKRKIKFSIHNIERAKPDKRQRTDDQVENRQGDFNLSENSTSSHPEMNNPDGSMNGTDSSDKNNENQKKSKYRRTGETTMMMNSMFAAAFKNKSVCETESDSNISNEARYVFLFLN